MPRFEPFAGIRYDADVDLERVTAPPYDVIGPDELTVLEGRSPYNVVHVDLARENDRYEQARCRFDEWLATGVLAPDDGPGFYVYRMGYRDESERLRQTSGVIGALELSVPGEADVLPHERTMSKPKDDRLDLMRACRANLSAIWLLSLAEGLSALCEPTGPPVARCTDDDGVHHRLWRITQGGVIDAISQAVASAPAVIADGHHRYETALAYRDERRADVGPGPHDLILAYVVELAEDQLSVGPIHRLISGLPAGFDVAEALLESFDESPEDPTTPSDGPVLVTRDGRWGLRRRDADHSAPDAVAVDAALVGLPPHDVAYQHGIEATTAMVDKGEADAAVLLRPTTVAQIAAVARARERMPQKTTFFWPKPRTGMVFRRLQS